MLEFQCPHCKEILNIPEQFVGTTGTCKKCGGTISIESQATHDPTVELDAFSGRALTLVSFHCEATGPSSRKCNITELAGIKFGLAGAELDTFSSFANPGHLIPPRISEKTGITDEMVEHAPPSSEVVKMWFDWVGTNAILFSHHAHYDTRFVAATMLKDDIEPPQLRVIDVLSWSRQLDVPVEEYKLRPLLDFIGYRVKRAHRALETCHGVAALVTYLTKRQVGAHAAIAQTGVFDKLRGKGPPLAVNEEEAHRLLNSLSKTMVQMCGDDFFEKTRNDPRRTKTKGTTAPTAPPGQPEAVNESDNSGQRQQWFEEKRGQLEKCKLTLVQGHGVETAEAPQDAPWEYILLEASQSDNLEEQKRLCLEAVSMGARDPWPYSRLTTLLIKEKDYESAHSYCEKYFQSDIWKLPKWADSSLKILKRLEKLERRLQKSR